MSKKMYVLIGNYGSGKTELALNFAIGAAARGERTELLDLDMVNTYFRLTEPGRLMRMKDIRVVSPNFTNSSVETLSLPAEVQSAFAMDWDTVVLTSAEMRSAPLLWGATTRILKRWTRLTCRC